MRWMLCWMGMLAAWCFFCFKGRNSTSVIPFSSVCFMLPEAGGSKHWRVVARQLPCAPFPFHRQATPLQKLVPEAIAGKHIAQGLPPGSKVGLAFSLSSIRQGINSTRHQFWRQSDDAEARLFLPSFSHHNAAWGQAMSATGRHIWDGRTGGCSLAPITETLLPIRHMLSIAG